MKKFIIGVVFFFLCVACTPEKKCLYSIEMTLINSKVIVKDYYLPEKCDIYVIANGGSYNLVYGPFSGCMSDGRTIRAGVIDFTILSKKCQP